MQVSFNHIYHIFIILYHHHVLSTDHIYYQIIIIITVSNNYHTYVRTSYRNRTTEMVRNGHFFHAIHVQIFDLCARRVSVQTSLVNIFRQHVDN